MQEAEYTPEMLREFESKVPLKRVGCLEEVAALFVFWRLTTLHSSQGSVLL